MRLVRPGGRWSWLFWTQWVVGGLVPLAALAVPVWRRVSGVAVVTVGLSAVGVVSSDVSLVPGSTSPRIDLAPDRPRPGSASPRIDLAPDRPRPGSASPRGWRSASPRTRVDVVRGAGLLPPDLGGVGRAGGTALRLPGRARPRRLADHGNRPGGSMVPLGNATAFAAGWARPDPVGSVERAEEHERLFAGPGPVACPPFESYWREDVPPLLRRALMGPCTTELVALCARLDLQVGRSAAELPDHATGEPDALSVAAARPGRAEVAVTVQVGRDRVRGAE